MREPLSLSIEAMRLASPDGRLDTARVKVVLKHVLLALDFLHEEVGMVHGVMFQSSTSNRGLL